MIACGRCWNSGAGPWREDCLDVSGVTSMIIVTCIMIVTRVTFKAHETPSDEVHSELFSNRPARPAVPLRRDRNQVRRGRRRPLCLPGDRWLSRHNANAIAKHDECAAAASSSGLVCPPGCWVRPAQVTGSGPNAPLAACTSPAPSASGPSQTVVALRFAVVIFSPRVGDVSVVVLQRRERGVAGPAGAGSGGAGR